MSNEEITQEEIDKPMTAAEIELFAKTLAIGCSPDGSVDITYQNESVSIPAFLVPSLIESLTTRGQWLNKSEQCQIVDLS